MIILLEKEPTIVESFDVFMNPLQKSCDVCFILGCQHAEEWGHPCDRDEDGYHECDRRIKIQALLLSKPLAHEPKDTEIILNGVPVETIGTKNDKTN